MDYYTTFFYVLFVACVAGAKIEGEGRGSWSGRGGGGGGGEREIQGGRPRPLSISLAPNPLHLSMPATQAIFSIFSRKGGRHSLPADIPWGLFLLVFACLLFTEAQKLG